MTLEDQTFDAIHARLLADVDDAFDKRQGSVVYDMTAPTAAEASARLVTGLRFEGRAERTDIQGRLKNA